MKQRDLVITGRDEQGTVTLDFPITRLGNIENDADAAESVAGDDFIPVSAPTDGSKFKHATVTQILASAANALSQHAESTSHITEEERAKWNAGGNASIRTYSFTLTAAGWAEGPGETWETPFASPTGGEEPTASDPMAETEPSAFDSVEEIEASSSGEPAPTPPSVDPYYYQDIMGSGVGTDDAGIVTFAEDASSTARLAAATAKISLSKQLGGNLRFVASSSPTADIPITIIVFGAGGKLSTLLPWALS